MASMRPAPRVALSIFTLVFVSLYIGGCTPAERTAYNTIVAASAFTKKMAAQHAECASPMNVSSVCVSLARAVGAKDLLIDAAEVYCSGPNFNNGGACDAPKKGTPAQQQAAAKLQAAIAAYNAAAADLKAVIR